MKRSLRTLTFFSLCSFTMLFGSLVMSRAIGDRATIAVEPQTWVQSAAVVDTVSVDLAAVTGPAAADTAIAGQDTGVTTSGAVTGASAVTSTAAPVATPIPTPIPTPAPTPTPASTPPPVDTRCLVQIAGGTYDVTSLRKTHSGGNVFTCGTDMTAIFQSQHGTNYSLIAKYKI
ncbi:hypothetical protein AUK40_01925 [Candidatus Wirthbacteria bacterium CG2_30_54_11]|uniref:Cytochrome b5 heme-binding domain-containing protein n=1 Tax=Candidatus Wirthbacteria bacterium CG2_30_54_11 TaxID=1817892 RepID=A0A1J5IM29_9BACT|nr:MAG: hypothetical protein AUK40_01925 [Candidatus Wirthbacteria bacterium CG2_30_54_11]